MTDELGLLLLFLGPVVGGAGALGMAVAGLRRRRQLATSWMAALSIVTLLGYPFLMFGALWCTDHEFWDASVVVIWFVCIIALLLGAGAAYDLVRRCQQPRWRAAAAWCSVVFAGVVVLVIASNLGLNFRGTTRDCG